MTSGRTQRWALTLGAYTYTIRYKKGNENMTADAISRLPLPLTREEPLRPPEVMMEYLDASPVTSSHIRRWTDQDPVIAKVKEWVLTGWPEKLQEKELRAYFHRKREFSLEDGCLLWGSRVVVPEKTSCILATSSSPRHF